MDDMIICTEKGKQEATISLLETLERHGYMKICEFMDKGYYAEAHKVADLLERVGII